jgi:hypothetical protein
MLREPKPYKISFILLSLVIGSLLMDNFLSLYYIDFDINNQLDLMVFSAVVSIFIIAQVFMVKQFIIREKSIAHNKSNFITYFSKTITILVTGIIIFVAIQVISFTYYYTLAIEIGITVSYVASLILFGFLVYRLLTWYKEEKEFIILIYAIAITSIIFRIASILLMENILVSSADFTRSFESIVTFLELEPGTLVFHTGNWYSISSIVSYLLLWLANALFLRNYYKKFSRLKYFLLVILLPSFTMIDYVVNQTFVESGEIEPLLFDILVVIEGVLSGILLAIPYFIIARSIKDMGNNTRYQLIFTGFGLIIFGISGSAIIDHVPFPPFGFTSIISMQLAALIIYVSLYNSAVSFSKDSVLRKSINKQMNGIAHLLQKIGNSEMNKQMLDNTIEAQQKVYNELTEINNISPTMDSDKIKEYIDIISEEIRLGKK